MTFSAAGRTTSWCLWTVAAVLFTAGAVTSARVSPARAGGTFGVERFENTISMNREGAPATQAGSHPYAMTTTIMFNHHEEEGQPFPDGGNLKNVEVNLPAGLIVNPAATEARCTETELQQEQSATQHPRRGCPDSAAVGVATTYVNGPVTSPTSVAIYNMVPPPGVPGEFAFNVLGQGAIVHLLGRVRTGGDYGLSADVLKYHAEAGTVRGGGHPVGQSVRSES